MPWNPFAKVFALSDILQIKTLGCQFILNGTFSILAQFSLRPDAQSRLE